MSSTSEATEESFDTRSISAAEFDVSDPSILPFSSFSPPLFSRNAGSMDQTIPELSHADLADSHNSPQLCFSDPQGYPTFPSLLGFPYDTESSRLPTMQSCDSKPTMMGLNAQTMTDSEALAGQDSWGNSSTGLPNASLDHHGNQFARLPATPPLSEASQDIPITTPCPQSYSVYREAAFVETTTLPSQTFSIGEPFYPLTPPLSEQDPNRYVNQRGLGFHTWFKRSDRKILTNCLDNRTIRPVKQPQRPLLSAATVQPSGKTEPELFSLPVALGPRFKEGSESRSPRDHPFYAMPTRSDGKYHCPFSTGEKACAHTPTTQKCAYQYVTEAYIRES